MSSDLEPILPTEAPEPQGIFVAKHANEWMEEAAKRPDPVRLWYTLMYENEVTCLFADTNVGKSIYAVQIANKIAQSQPVIYFDFEMSDKQFQLRYTDPETGAVYNFHPNLNRAEYNGDIQMLSDIDEIIDSIVLESFKHNAKVLIIDNISWICNRSESGDAAGLLMQRLVEIKRKFGLSILVLAHTPKRNMAAPLSQNSLAGSKKLANFFDSIFAIGIDKNNLPHGRYIKQIKIRSGELIYGENSVIVAKIVKDGPSLEFEHLGFDWERNLLEAPDEEDIVRDEARAEIQRRLREGSSYRTIQRELHVSPRDISRAKKDMQPGV